MSAAPERPDLESYLKVLQGCPWKPCPGCWGCEEVGPIIAYALHVEAQRDAARAALMQLAKGVLALEQYRFEPGEWRSCPMCNRWLEQHPEAGHTEDCELVPLLALAAVFGEAGHD